MIKCNGKPVEVNHFPDGTLLVKEDVTALEEVTLTWLFENNEELVALYFLTKHIRSKGIWNITLQLPYIPNARQDRVKKPEDIFTLKYFAELINSLEFKKVVVLDPHSYVSEALFDRLEIRTPKAYVEQVLERLTEGGAENIMMFYPDEGAMKRYANMFDKPYAFGIKKRDWSSGEILGLEVSGQAELVKGSCVLIVDDICSKGGTFYYSAKALKELGAKEVYLYVSHCENSIFQGEILKSDVIQRVYTTDSILTKNDEKVEIIKYE